MIRYSGAILAGALLLPSIATADLENDIAICGGAQSSPREVVASCQRALKSRRLKQGARIQVLSNLSIGFLEIGQNGSAINAANDALSIDPAYVPALLNRAKANERLRRLSAAAADYEAAIASDSNSAEAFAGRGALLLRNGDAYRAVGDLTAAVRIAPEWGTPRFNRGLAYLEIGQMSRAVQDFSELIRQRPDDAGAHLYRAQARARLGDDAASADFDRAIDLASEWGLAWFVRGRYRDGLGDREGANADFLRAYQLGHSDPWLIERVREISG